MSSSPKKINSLKALEGQIIRLKADAKRMEAQMDDNFNRLHEKGLSMTLNSILPEKVKYRGIPATIVGLLVEHDRLQDTLVKLVEKILDRTSEGIDYVAEKLKRTKTKPD